MLDKMTAKRRAEMEDHYITIGDYITHLEELLSKYRGDTDDENTDALISFQMQRVNIDIPPIPGNPKINNIPRFKAGSFTRKDIADLLGKAFFILNHGRKKDKQVSLSVKRKRQNNSMSLSLIVIGI